MKRIEMRQRWISICKKLISHNKQTEMQRMNFFNEAFYKIVLIDVRKKFQIWRQRTTALNRFRIAIKWHRYSRYLLSKSKTFMLKNVKMIYQTEKNSFLIWKEKYENRLQMKNHKQKWIDLSTKLLINNVKKRIICNRKLFERWIQFTNFVNLL